MRRSRPWDSRSSEERTKVLAVSRLEKFQAAVFDERDASSREHNFKLVAMVARPEQDGLSFQIDPCFSVLQNALNDVLDLSPLVGCDDQLWFLPRSFV